MKHLWFAVIFLSIWGGTFWMVSLAMKAGDKGAIIFIATCVSAYIAFVAAAASAEDEARNKQEKKRGNSE